MITEWFLFDVRIFQADKLIGRLSIIEANQAKALELAKSHYFRLGIEQIYIVQCLAKIFRQPISKCIWQSS